MKESTYSLAQRLGQQLAARGWHVGTAESCTGGLIAAAITDVAGSSSWFEEGLVTYANASKQQLLGVSEADLQRHGAVSRAVVEAMVAGVLARGADIAVSTSGVAGPDGGTPEKPVGTVWIAWGTRRRCEAKKYCFDGDRQAVREQTVEESLRQLTGFLEKE